MFQNFYVIMSFCHTWLHLGFPAKLKIWQVPACKMEPQRGIILMKPPATHPPPTHPPATHLFFQLLDNLGSWNFACRLNLQNKDNQRGLGHLSRQHLSWRHLSYLLSLRNNGHKFDQNFKYSLQQELHALSIWRFSGGCHESLLRVSCQFRTRYIRSFQVMSDHIWSGHVRSGLRRLCKVERLHNNFSQHI